MHLTSQPPDLGLSRNDLPGFLLFLTAGLLVILFMIWTAVQKIKRKKMPDTADAIADTMVEAKDDPNEPARFVP